MGLLQFKVPPPCSQSICGVASGKEVFTCWDPSELQVVYLKWLSVRRLPPPARLTARVKFAKCLKLRTNVAHVFSKVRMSFQTDEKQKKKKPLFFEVFFSYKLQPKEITVCLKCLLVNPSSSNYSHCAVLTSCLFFTASFSCIYVQYVFVFHTKSDSSNSLNLQCNKPTELWLHSDSSYPWQPSVKVTPSAFTLLPKHTRCVRVCVRACWCRIHPRIHCKLKTLHFRLCDCSVFLHRKKTCCKSSVFVCLCTCIHACYMRRWGAESKYDDRVSQQFTKWICVLICNGKKMCLSFITFCLYWNIKLNKKNEKASHPRVFFIMAVVPPTLPTSTLLYANFNVFCFATFCSIFQTYREFLLILSILKLAERLIFSPT